MEKRARQFKGSNPATGFGRLIIARLLCDGHWTILTSTGEKTLVKRSIKSKEVIADIRVGMNDLELTEKYRLTPRGLETLLGHLVDNGLIGERELEDREQLTASQIIRAVIDSRRDRRILS